MQQQDEDDLELSPEALAALTEFAVQVRVSGFKFCDAHIHAALPTVSPIVCMPLRS